MPFSGAGTFSPYTPGNPVVSGATISSSAFNNTISDLANGLSNTMTRDGQSPATADIPMGSHKITGLAAASVAGDAVRYEQITGLAPLASPTFTGTVTAPTFVGALTGNVTGNVTGSSGTATTAGNLTGTPTLPNGAAAVTQATTDTSAKLATNQFVHSLAYGSGMAYTNTGNTIGTTYTNSTAKVRKVSAFATSAVGGNNWWGGNVNSVTIAISNASVSAGSTIAIQFDVPPGATYSISHGAGATPAASWYEA